MALNQLFSGTNQFDRTENTNSVRTGVTGLWLETLGAPASLEKGWMPLVCLFWVVVTDWPYDHHYKIAFPGFGPCLHLKHEFTGLEQWKPECCTRECHMHPLVLFSGTQGLLMLLNTCVLPWPSLNRSHLKSLMTTVQLKNGCDSSFECLIEFCTCPVRCAVDRLSSVSVTVL